MCPYLGTHIASDICSPTQETHIHSDMCSQLGCVFLYQEHVICVSQVRKPISLRIHVPRYGKLISLGICISHYGNTYHWKYVFPSRERLILVICVPLLGNIHITSDMCTPTRENISLEICLMTPGFKPFTVT